MAIIDPADIRGAYVDERLFCANCLDSFEGLELTDLVLTQDIESEDKLYFCDECGTQLS